MSADPRLDSGPAAAAPERLIVSPSPHLRSKDTTASIMMWVAIALLPGIAVSFWFFGLEALRTMVIAVVSCLAFEFLSMKMLKTKGSLKDMSALVTGMLLGMNLPPTAPWWMIAAGGLIAMFVAKHLFGGLGSNIFNPALTARVFLLIAWPVHMTTWLTPGVRGLVTPEQISTVTGATPLGLLNESAAWKVAHLNPTDLLLGNVGGSLGEISAIALILGGVILLAKKIITWEIPVFFIGTTFAITGLAWLYSPYVYADPVTQILTGGLMLGAFFMATDMVTSPITFRGRVVFGIGCGLLTALIRLWGIYPEGVSFAILLMNAVTPLIDHFMVPRTFGTLKQAEVAK